MFVMSLDLSFFVLTVSPMSTYSRIVGDALMTPDQSTPMGYNKK